MEDLFHRPEAPGLVLNAQEAEAVLELLNTAVSFAADEARRIRSAPESDGYTQEDKDEARIYYVGSKTFVADLRRRAGL